MQKEKNDKKNWRSKNRKWYKPKENMTLFINMIYLEENTLMSWYSDFLNNCIEIKLFISFLILRVCAFTLTHFLKTCYFQSCGALFIWGTNLAGIFLP